MQSPQGIEDELFSGWIASQHPLDVYANVVGAVMLVIAAAQVLASFHADRRALRLFALRYVLAALGWWFAHPRLHTGASEAPFLPMVVAVALLALTVWALDEFLGSATARRRTAIAAGSAAVVAALWLHRQALPDSAVGIYLVIAGVNGLCALMAWQATRREPDVGHGVVALAFASYPVTALAVWGSGRLRGDVELGYLAAGPGILVGVTVLVVSLIRAERRVQRELVRREAAEARLTELNQQLEQRVAARTAELRSLVEGLGAYTRNVSHDLRGPLAGVAGVVHLVREALARGDLDRAQAHLAVVAPELDRMQVLVADLLALSRLDDAALRREPRPLHELAAVALQQLAMSPDTAPLLQRVQVDLGELPTAEVDVTMVTQVFVNLIGNALRFAATTGPAARARIEGRRSAAGRVSVCIADNGPGFPASQAARLFEPFTRLHGGGLSQHGIGLSIVRRIVERHGGRVWAESSPGQGAAFSFELPASG